MKQQNAGFTLLELVVVIAIIGVLVGSVVVGSFSSTQKRARDVRRKSDVVLIQNAMEQYFSTCGYSYPTNLSSGISCGSEAILTTLPVDPKTAVAYPLPTLSTSEYQICTNNLEYETPTGYCVTNQQ